MARWVASLDFLNSRPTPFNIIRESKHQTAKYVFFWGRPGRSDPVYAVSARKLAGGGANGNAKSEL